MNRKGQGIEILGMAAAFILIIFAVITIVPTYYDFDALTGSDNTLGEFEIDEDALENIEENVEDFQEKAFENFDFAALSNFLFFGILIIVSSAIIVFVLIKIVKHQ